MPSLRSLELPWLVIPALLVGALSPALAGAPVQIQGQVRNGTLGKPASDQSVELLQPRGGMQQVATAVTDADGRFVIPASNLDTSSFYLFQAVYQGVNYHAPVKFDSDGGATVELTIYESAQAAPALRVQSARLIVRAQGEKVRVQELFAVQNPSQPPRTYVNPDGTFHIRLSPEAGQPTAAVAGIMNMPLPQTASPGKAPGEFSIAYPLKPGLTVVMMAYERDYSAGRLELGDAVPYPIGTAELFVLPPSLAVDSPLFKPAGMDSETGSQKLTAENLRTGTALAARLSGTAAAEAEAEAGQAEPEIKILPNSIMRLGVPLLLCFLLVLLWALGVRVAKEWPRWKQQRDSSHAQKELEGKVEALFNSLADLDELFATQKIAEKRYWKERLELKARLVATLKKAPPSLLEFYATRHTPR